VTLDEERWWARLATGRHGVLGTVHPGRGVDVVPVAFAVLPAAPRALDTGVVRPRVVIPVDTIKPKRSGRLQRMRNLEADARCVLLVDHYDDDWSRLWWVRVHARATPASVDDDIVARLADRYPQYREPGSVVGALILEPTEVSGWSAGRMP
jgi:PPOX class probable F420-dependent enzyme